MTKPAAVPPLLNRRHFLGAALALPALAQHHEAPAMPSAADVLRDLKEGNARFVAGRPKRPHGNLVRVHEVVAAQLPKAVVLTCSDSRVPPEVVFDHGIGDLFVVRVAGNVANNDEIASSEYAIEHFGTTLFVVLGHSQCGAVSAVVNGDHVPEDIARLVAPIGAAVGTLRKSQPKLQGAELIAASVRENVIETVARIPHECAPIAARVREGRLKIVGAVYNLTDGAVSWI